MAEAVYAQGALGSPPSSKDSLRGGESSTGAAAAPKKKKICCACPDSKQLRDECIALNGPDDPTCLRLIEAHKVCLRSEGFNV